MFTKTVRISRIVALARIPDVFMMSILVWIRLNGVVSISAHEKPVNWAALPVNFVLPVHVLRIEHRDRRYILRLLHHGRVWFQIWSIVPGIAATEFFVGDPTSEK